MRITLFKPGLYRITVSLGMKACVYRGPFNVVLEEIDVPKIGSKDVLLKINLAGICGSDLEVFRGKRTVRIPLVMGHEAVGTVVEVGKDVENLRVGDTVVIEPNIYCGKCYNCRKGRMDICENKVIYGINRNGVFSEYVDVPESFAWRVPGEVSPYEAVLVEPLSVVLRAIRRLSLSPSDNVLIIGGGPLGAITAKILQYMNVNYVVTEVIEPRISVLKQIGIERVVNASREDSHEIIKYYFDGAKADYVLDTVSNTDSFAQTFRWLKPGGKAVVLGLLSHKAEVEVFPLVRGTLSIEGSVIYLGDYVDSLRLLKRKDISRELVKVITHRFKLAECSEAFKLATSGNCLKVVFEL
ncbi:MAG: alcohol dehydrogenase catalytic domain-containing protein [Sulfolobales archaeon]